MGAPGAESPGGHYRGPAAGGRPPGARHSGSEPWSRTAGCRTRKGAARRPLPWSLPAETESLDQRPVASDVGLGEVLQQPASPADQQQQAAPAVVVVLVRAQVLGQ